MVTETAFDALLLLSFGGPQGPDEVMPFLRKVTSGRGIPAERLAEVAKHYLHYDGISPITAQNEALIEAIRAEFSRRGLAVPVYFGNRNWHPFLADTARQMVADGVRNALVLATSATASYSGCRQYREDLASTSAELGATAPTFTKVRHYFDHPGFITANADGVRQALFGLSESARATARLVFTAHSIPESMNAGSGPSGGLYLGQQRTTARLVAEAVRGPAAEYDLVWQSRSGPPQVAWLEPDVNDHLRTLAADGITDVVVVPTGFISDHMEVVWDLDNEARDTANELGMGFVRAATAGTHPAFVSGLVDLFEEYLSGAPPQLLGDLGPCGIDCPATCCPAPQRRGS
ncbi:MAG: protoporphyrin/coproporphyrin ferrochelatase [Pseudonocardiales bacterium]|nr:protoporphyrin/coproporphyrin ferrochelatase [Pseudonocardiales bacterium]